MYSSVSFSIPHFTKFEEFKKSSILGFTLKFYILKKMFPFYFMI